MNSSKFVSLVFILFLHEATPRSQQGLNNFLHRTRNIWSKSLQKDNYLELALDLHNALRDEHNTPHAKINAELVAAAQSTAEAMVNSADFEGLKYWRSGIESKFSQNVFNISDEWLTKRPSFAILYAITGWYDPVYDYEHKNPTVSSFTRLIWKASTEFGIGIASKGNNDTVIVANYSPSSEEVVTPENRILFQENVLPERKKPGVDIDTVLE